MESSQQIMILNLLNLYFSYVNLKRENEDSTEKKQFSNICTSRQVQKVQKLKHHNGNKFVSPNTLNFHYKNQTGTVSHNVTTTNSKTIDNSVSLMNNREKNTSLDNCSLVDSSEVFSEPFTKSITDDTEGEENIEEIKRGQGQTLKKYADRKPRIRRWRVRPINRDRVFTGYHRKVFANVKKMDQQQFFEHTRMSKSLFDWLLTFLHSSLRKSKQSIFAEERLAITLNYLAYGTSLQSIAFKHKIGKSTARQIVLSTCSVLWDLLAPIYLSKPTTSQYADIAEDFKNKWGIPNCVGAIAGKHVSVRAPVFKKEALSMLVLGICDTKYKFTAVNVGNSDNQSGEGTLQISSLINEIIPENLPLPSSKPLLTSSSPFPHYFISDGSLPLRRNIVGPYTEAYLDAAKTIFNYKISCARTVTENTFGILTARFRVLLTAIEFVPNNCKTIILACIALHNFIMTNDEEQLYCPANFVDRESESGNIIEGEWRNELKNSGDQPLPIITSIDTTSTYKVNKLRDVLADFFANETISYEVKIVEHN